MASSFSALLPSKPGFILIQDTYTTPGDAAMMYLVTNHVKRGSKVVLLSAMNTILHYSFLMKKLGINVVELEENNKFKFVEIAGLGLNDLQHVIGTLFDSSECAPDCFIIDGLTELYFSLPCGANISANARLLDVVNVCHQVRSLLGEKATFACVVHGNLSDNSLALYLAHEADFVFKFLPLETGFSPSISGQCNIMEKQKISCVSKTYFFKYSDSGLEIKSELI